MHVLCSAKLISSQSQAQRCGSHVGKLKQMMSPKGQGKPREEPLEIRNADPLSSVAFFSSSILVSPRHRLELGRADRSTILLDDMPLVLDPKAVDTRSGSTCFARSSKKVCVNQKDQDWGNGARRNFSPSWAPS